LWLHSLKVAQLLRSAACLHTNQSRSYFNQLLYKFINVHPVFPRIIYVIFASTYCRLNCPVLFCIWGTRSGADGSDTALQAGRSRFRIPMLSLDILSMALELNQFLIEMSTRNISWGIKAAGA